MNWLTAFRWPRIWVLGVVLCWCLTGCQPKIYQPSLPPPPPPKPAPPPQVKRPILYVSVGRLNLRACPGMDCPKISVLERNEQVEKIGESEDWAQVRVTRDGRLGWVNTRYLAAEPVPSGPPEAPAPAPPSLVTPPPLPEAPPVPAPAAKPPEAEKPKPAKAPEQTPPAAKKKAEEKKPTKAPKPAEAAETPARKPAPAAEKPKPAEKPAAPAEKPAPPAEPGGEQQKRIRIM